MRKVYKVFLDTSALIPLIEESHPNHKSVRRYLCEGKKTYCMDTVVLSEYLTGISPEKQESTKNSLVQQFPVYSFSQNGALIGARLFKHLCEKNNVPKTDSGKQILRVDIFILASAIENQADIILFEDKHFSTMIENLQDFPKEVLSLPHCQRIQDIQIQPDFFDNDSNM